MKNGLLASDKGHHGEPVACQASWIWERSQSQTGLWVCSLGLPVQTADEVCLSLAFDRRDSLSFKGGKGKPHSIQSGTDLCVL